EPQGGVEDEAADGWGRSAQPERPSEETGITDLEGRPLPDDLWNHDGEPEGGDGEIRASQTEHRPSERETDQAAGQTAGGQGQPEGDVGSDHEQRGGVRAHR